MIEHITEASKEDLENILQLQYHCYRSEAELYQDESIQPLTQTLADIEQEYEQTKANAIFTYMTNLAIASSRRLKSMIV